MKQRVLISGLGGSMFPYLHRQIEEDFTIWYADSDESLKNIYPDLTIFTAPPAKSDDYEDFIFNIISENEITLYIPLIDEEILTSLKLAERCPGLLVLTPRIEFSRLCLNKYDLMRKLAETGISDIKTGLGSRPVDDIPAPYFIKPVVGRGSRGAMEIADKEKLGRYLELYDGRPDELLIQECCRGVEYTVGVLVNRENQILSIGTRQIIQKKGITLSAVTGNDEQINDVSHRIVEAFEPAGPFNIQLYKTAEGEIKIFEINPRFSTTSIMSYEGGVNEIRLYLDHLDDTGPVDIVYPEEGLYLKRTWNNNFYR